MYDLEDDIDALTSSRSEKNISSINLNIITDPVKLPNSILVTSQTKKQQHNKNLDDLTNCNEKPQIKWADQKQTTNNSNSQNYDIPKLDFGFPNEDPNDQKNDINILVKTNDNFSAKQVDSDSTNDQPNVIDENIENELIDEATDFLFQRMKTPIEINDKKESSDLFKSTTKSEDFNYDSDEFEDEITEEIVTEPLPNTKSTFFKEEAPKTPENTKNTKESIEQQKRNDIEEIKPIVNTKIIELKNDVLPLKKDSTPGRPPSPTITKCPMGKSPIVGLSYDHAKESENNDYILSQKLASKLQENLDSERGRCSQRAKNSISSAPSIKPALIKPDKLSQLSSKESRGRSTRPSAPGASRQGRPPTPAAPRTARISTSSVTSTSSSSSTSSRHSNIRYASSKSSLSTPVQPTMHKQEHHKSRRKSSPSPVMPSTTVRPSSARPVKAIHSSSSSKRIQSPIQSHQRPPSASRSRGLPGTSMSSNLSMGHRGVRKAASTTDLHRYARIKHLFYYNI